MSEISPTPAQPTSTTPKNRLSFQIILERYIFKELRRGIKYVEEQKRKTAGESIFVKGNEQKSLGTTTAKDEDFRVLSVNISKLFSSYKSRILLLFVV